MKKSAWKTYAFWIVLAELVGALSGWLIREGVEIYNKTVIQPPLSPPAIVFPIVWGILFALMGFGAAEIYLSPASAQRTCSLWLFFLQLAFNFLWSIIFFNLRNFGFAFFWLLVLWVLILLMIISYRKISKLASRLQVPYFVWVTFAAYLNLGVWILNK